VKDQETRDGIDGGMSGFRAAAGTTPDGSTPSALPTVALPKGGGAIRGIGEKFSVNPVTGTASLSVPIVTTAGRSDFAPQLTLTYDSGSGNGSFGLGWGLSVPSISRKTDKEIPRYEPGDASDTFVLSGTEDLVPAYSETGGAWEQDVRDDGAYRVYRYRPRTEGLFARIERWEDRATSDVHWRSVAKDNITSIYGRSAACRIADPDTPRRVFRWLLEESRDDRGNIIVYEHKAENADGVDPGASHEATRLALGAAFANRYLKRIHYGNTTPGQPTGWRFHVVFDYGEHDTSAPTLSEATPWTARLDPFSTGRAGFEIRSYRLCRRVLMFHEFPELGNDPCLVRSTDFVYDEQPVATYLRSVTQRGYIRHAASGQYTHGELPPLEFQYTQRDSNLAVHDIEHESVRNLPYGIDGARYQWLDLDSEGIAGVLTEETGAWYYKRNRGGARFGSLERVSPLPALANLTGGGQQILDLAGDGRQYLVQLGGELPGYQARENGGWGPFTPFAALPTIVWSDPNLKFIDLNGDGFSDVLISEDECFTWYPSRARQGFAPAEIIRKPADEDRGPRLVFADGTDTVYTADMSGDGLADLVRIRNGEVCYWPNLGHGRFGAKVVMSTSPRFAAPDEFDPACLRLADIDGSGTTDIIYLGPREPTLWFNQAGNGWSSPERLAVLPPTDPVSHVMVADLLGRGTACLLWSSPLPHEAARPIRFVDLVGGRKPHLLQSIRNNLGLETAIEYDASTSFYVADREAGRPWVTKLPFPVHVVTRMETRDWIADTKLVTTYRYRHGYYDGVEREFRGFGYVEQRDTESFSEFNGAGAFTQPPRVIDHRLYVPAVLTKSWFHTGFFLDENNISKHFADEYYAGDPQAALLPDTLLPAGLTAAEAREACRALRGQLLRQEVYGLDDSSLTFEPYLVSERNCTVTRVQPTLNNRHAVFYTHPREALTYHYERQPADPRVVHDLTLDVDAFGNVRRAATVAYPRRAPAFPEQGQMRVTFTERDVINRADDPTFYQIGLVADVRTWELTGVPAPALTVYAPGEIVNGIGAAAEIAYEVAPTPGRVEKRLIQRVRTSYYGNEAAGELPLGQAGVPALVYRTYRQAFTPGLLTQVFADRVADTMLADEAKYVKVDGVWWAPSGRNVFDPARFYIPAQLMDPFEAVWTNDHDPYALLVTSITDPLGNVVRSKNNYRTLLPYALTDPNGNRTAVRYDALGVVVATAVMGKIGETQGDVLDDTSSEATPSDDPTARLEYHRSEWKDHGRPTYVHAFMREQHGAANPRWQESYTYSDGTGREAMKKMQAEPGPAPIRDADGHLQHGPDGTLLQVDTTPNVRWVGTGRTVVNNKGNPVKQYEPFFSRTPDWETEEEVVESGVTPMLTYDPLGRLIRTDFPDATFSTVAFDSWRQETWDQNDTVLQSGWLASRLPDFDPANPPANPTPDQAAAIKAARHAATPSVAYLDALGRAFRTVEDNGAAGQYPTAIELDIDGHQRSVTDARGRTVMQYDFDMLGSVIRSRSVDAGERRMLNNAAGKRSRSYDSRQHVMRMAYDQLQRPTHLFVTRGAGTEALAERTVYGEAHPDSTVLRKLNLRGRVFMQFDGAGVVTNASRNGEEAYDFKGNVLHSERQLSRDYTQQTDWKTIAPLLTASVLSLADIDAALAPLLESETFTTRTTFDALNRPITITTPDASMILPAYNEANLLERLSARLRGAATATPFVTNVDYNARGQREQLRYGNDVLTAYHYDRFTFRLARTETTRADGAVLQDLGYAYDPVGNISAIDDDAQPTIYFSNSVVSPTCRYEYDALYRLIRAEGREHIGQGAQPQVDYDDSLRMNRPLPNDGQAMRRYVERYEYDPVGNILEMIHEANSSGSWTRRYAYDPNSNHLQSTSAPGDPDGGPFSATYEYDPDGNMTTMPHLSRMESHFKNQLCQVDLGGGGTVYYTYDAGGQRVRKVVERQDGLRTSERIYVGAYEIFRAYDGSAAPTLERQSLHVMDDRRRIAMVEMKTVDSTAPLFTPALMTRYQLGNHLDSVALELDEAARVISYEEYHPYGTTSYQATRSGVEASAKRYRYTGKERDEETALYYHGARYYAAWLARWTSCDPLGLADGPNVYSYVNGSPTGMKDPTGTQGVPQKIRVPPEPDPATKAKAAEDLRLAAAAEANHYGATINQLRLTMAEKHDPGDPSMDTRSAVRVDTSWQTLTKEGLDMDAQIAVAIVTARASSSGVVTKDLLRAAPGAAVGAYRQGRKSGFANIGEWDPAAIVNDAITSMGLMGSFESVLTGIGKGGGSSGLKPPPGGGMKARVLLADAPATGAPYLPPAARASELMNNVADEMGPWVRRQAAIDVRDVRLPNGDVVRLVGFHFHAPEDRVLDMGDAIAKNLVFGEKPTGGSIVLHAEDVNIEETLNFEGQVLGQGSSPKQCTNCQWKSWLLGLEPSKNPRLH
jgi:RHS repeat-associated protein